MRSRERAPDGTTLLRFRRHLENPEMRAALFRASERYAGSTGLKYDAGTIMDAA
jgi:IS5 family transposase